jgi:hypothetical protein
MILTKLRAYRSWVHYVAVSAAVMLATLPSLAMAQTEAVTYNTLSAQVITHIPALFLAMTAVFIALLVPKFAWRTGQFAARKLAGLASGRG